MNITLDKNKSALLEGIASLTLDFADLAYISSAGLRVLLALQKTMNRQGQMVLTIQFFSEVQP